MSGKDNSIKFKLFVAMKIPSELVEYLESKNFDVTIAKTVPVPRKELLESVIDCDAIFCTPSITVDKELLYVAKNLKVILIKVF